MPRNFHRRPIKVNKDMFPKVFCLHKQPQKPEDNFKSTSYYSKDKESLHLEICVPNKKFYPYTILNTSYNNIKEITIFISDGTKKAHKPDNKKDFILEINFNTDNLQNSNIKPLVIKDKDEVNVIIINDLFDFDNNNSIQKDKKSEKIIFSPEPKEDGGGVIIEGP
jgi:hypothetical protein